MPTREPLADAHGFHRSKTIFTTSTNTAFHPTQLSGEGLHNYSSLHRGYLNAWQYIIIVSSFCQHDILILLGDYLLNSVVRAGNMPQRIRKNPVNKLP